MSIASLPMYDLPELRAATDAWWRGLARALARAGIADVPGSLARPADPRAQWHDPALLFSQTCGYPLVHGLKGLVVPVATPAYAATGCAGANYCSLVVVRADDPAADLAGLAGRRCAVNAWDSQSGCNALRHAVAPHGRDGRFFAEVLLTGSHAASLEAVAAARADVAAVDCVSFALIERVRPAAVEALRVLERSAPAPGLPYVTRAAADGDLLDRLRDGLMAALADPELAAARAALLLTGAEVLPAEAYGRLIEMETEAAELGYPKVA